MRNLTTAIYGHAVTDAVGSGFMTSIGSRFYDTEAPAKADFPYCVYLVVTDVKDWQFTERMEDVLIQFSIFSTASSSGEIKDIYTKLNTLFDECVPTITGSRSLWFWRNNLTTMRDEITTPTGTGGSLMTVGVWHYAVDFDVYNETN
jgi:hypothetical protein